MPQIILASQSPRRKQLLEEAGIVFEIITQNIAETYPQNLHLHKIPEYIALNKAKAVQQYIADNITYNDAIIVGADTLVLLDDKIIGKPADENDAINILQSLSGKTHHVITGVAILHQQKQIVFSDITDVTFKILTQQQVQYYVQRYKPFDKAGAYAIQEWIGLIGISSIKGDYYNVMGLPVNKVVDVLELI